MNECRLRFLCTDQGTHKVRVLTTIHAVETPKGFELAWTSNSKGVHGTDPKPPKGGDRIVNESANYSTHLMWSHDISDPISTMRTSMQCPTCPRKMTLNESTLTRFFRDRIHTGGIWTVDISTGAILHKQ